MTINPVELAKQSGLLLLCSIWLLVGLVGHDPWKPDEAYTFGIVYHIIQTNDWLVPTLAGEPFMEKPPLFYLTAAVFAKALSPWLALHDAARLAAGLYLALTLLFVAASSVALNGRGYAWIAVIVLIGCIGLFYRAHQLITDTALLTGLALGLYGLAVAPERVVRGGVALGVGAAIAFLAKGLLGPGLLGITALGLFAFSNWRNGKYVQALAIAIVVGAPLLLLWPLALYVNAPALFDEWLWTHNFGRFFGYVRLGPQAEPLYYVRNLPWIAWPAWVLALWTLVVGVRGHRGGLAKPAIQLPMLFLFVTFCVLAFAADARELYALPMLLPIALLAVSAIDSLPRGVSAALDWFGILTFGALALATWALWAVLLNEWPPTVHAWLLRYRPGYVGEFRWSAFLVALFLSAVWLALIRPARQSNRRTMVNWAAGVTLLWGLAFSLFQDAVDYGNSYRSTVAALVAHLPPQRSCIASRELGEPQRAMLHYFADLLTIREELRPAHRCDVLLTQGGRDEKRPGMAWRKVWEGARPGDNSERLRLYLRDDQSISMREGGERDS